MLQILFNGIIAEQTEAIRSVAGAQLLGQCGLEFFDCGGAVKGDHLQGVGVAVLVVVLERASLIDTW